MTGYFRMLWRPFWKLLRTFWKVLFALAALIGILYLPKDISGLPEATGVPRNVIAELWGALMSIDRESVLIGFYIILLFWIGWMDARPFVMKWWEKRKRPSSFSITDRVYSESYSLDDEGDEEDEEKISLYENIFYISIGNNLDTGKTLLNVQARIFHHGPPTLCKIKDSNVGEINLRHGELAYFEIGKLVSSQWVGLFNGKAPIEEKRLEIYKHNVPRGYLSFEVGSVNNIREYGLGYRSEDDTVWKVLVVISADDVKSATVNVRVDMGNLTSPVSCETVS